VDRAELLEFDASDAGEDVDPHVAFVGLDGGALKLIVELRQPKPLDVVGVAHLRRLDECAVLGRRDRLTQCPLGVGLCGEPALPAVLALAGGGVGDVADVRPLLPTLSDVTCCHSSPTSSTRCWLVPEGATRGA